jgi:hypothetical protein
MKPLFYFSLPIIFLYDIANAHHGLYLYDVDMLKEINGQIKEVRLSDPHSVLVIESQNSGVLWEVEGGAASGIIAAGLTLEYLRSGPIVLVQGFQTKDKKCQPRCKMQGVKFDFDK